MKSNPPKTLAITGFLAIDAAVENTLCVCVCTYVKRSEFLRFIEISYRRTLSADDPLWKQDAELPFELAHSVIAIQTVYNSTRVTLKMYW